MFPRAASSLKPGLLHRDSGAAVTPKAAAPTQTTAEKPNGWPAAKQDHPFTYRREVYP